MRDADRKKAEAVHAPATDRAPATDPGAKALVARNGKLGNDAVQQMLQQSAETRDALLRFATERLGSIRDLQVQELNESTLRDMERWWRQNSDSHKVDWGHPEPTRWRGVAELYDDAIRALCHGNVERGAQLLDKAIEAEQEERDATKKPMDLGSTKDPKAPDARGGVSSGQACGACEVPDDAAKLFAEINAVTTHLRDSPNRRRPRDPWWTVDEGEEEEEEAEGGKGRR